MREAQRLPPVITAVVHPCGQISIEGVVEAARSGLIAPILVGPPAGIRDAAQQAEADISSVPIEASHIATIRPQKRWSSSGKERPKP